MSGVITELQGVQIQGGGVAIANSPEIINFISPLVASIDSEDSKKVNIETQPRGSFIAVVNTKLSIQTGYINPIGSITALNPTLAQIRFTCDVPIRILNLYVAGISETDNGQVIFTLYKNGSSTALTVTLPIQTSDDGWTTGSDLTHTVDFAVTDYFTMRFDITGNALYRGSIYMEYIFL